MNGDELPEKWARTTLGALIDGFEAGRNLRAHGRPAGPSEFGVLKVSAVSWGRFDAAENKALLPGDAPRPKEFVRKGDLLISRANTTELVGAVALVDDDYPSLMLPDKVLRLRVRGSVVAPEFLLYALRIPSVRRYFEINGTGTSDSMRNLSQPKMEGAPVLLPPLNEQRRIVAKLEALQARSRRAREALDAVPPLLEKLRQSILAAAFRGDLTKDWRAKHKEVEPASKLLERIRVERRKKWEEAELAKMKTKGKAPGDDRWKGKYKEPEAAEEEGLPELPEGWCWARADDVCTHVVDCHNKTAPYVSAGVPLIRTTNVRNGLIDLTETRFVDEQTYAFWSRRCPPAPGDVIFTREAPMGEAGMVPPDTRLCMGQRMMLLRADGERLRRRFLLYAVQAPHVPVYADRLSVGTGVRHLRVGDVEALPIPVAPALEQIAVEEAVDSALARHSTVRVATLEIESDLPRLETVVLAKAFRGELVPQDPNDEPAEAMLAKWREANGQGEQAGSERRHRGGRAQGRAGI